MAVVKIKDANGNWQNVVALKGDKGDTGDQGPAGPAGTTSFADLTDVPDRVKNAVSSIGGVTANSSGNVELSFIELLPESNENHGGYIDFHFNGSTQDNTSRIIEFAEGQLDIIAPNGVSVNGKSIGSSVRFLFDSSTVVATVSGKNSTSKTVALEPGCLYAYFGGCKDANDTMSISDIRSGGVMLSTSVRSLGNFSGYSNLTTSGVFLATSSTTVFGYSSTTSSGGVKFYKFNH